MENLKQFIALCFFKQQTKELAETTRLSSAVLFYGIVAIAIQINFLGSLGSIIAACFETLLTLMFAGYLALSNKILEEFTPFSCAIFVCSAFIASISVPFVLMLYIIKGKLALVISYSLVALFIWGIAAISAVFKKVLLLSTFRSVFLAISYVVIIYGGNFIGMLIIGFV